MSTVNARPYNTRSRGAANATTKHVTQKTAGGATQPSQPKRALGDITNAHLHTSHATNDLSTVPSGKVRRTVPTKPSSAAAARRSLAAKAQRARKSQLQEEQRRHGRSDDHSDDTPGAEGAAGAVAAAVAAASLATPGEMKDEEVEVAEYEIACASLMVKSSTSRRLSAKITRIPDGVSDIDAPDRDNPLAVSQFAPYIFENYLKAEKRFMVPADYMQAQDDITAKMRSILVDWLVDVHQKFKLTPETLHLTVNIIDRFLAVTPVRRRKLQLVGVTAMLIASKYEDIYAPETSDFVHISDNAYNRDEILHMEAVVLNVLKFDVTVPSSLDFLHRCLKAARATHHSSSSPRLSSYSMSTRSSTSPSSTASPASLTSVGAGAGGLSEDAEHFAMYLLELSLQSATMLPYSASVRAATSCMLAAKLFSESSWSPTLRHYSGNLQPENLAECEASIRALLIAEIDGLASNKLTAIKRKFGSPKFNEVSSRVTDLDLSADTFYQVVDSSGAGYASMDICPED